MPPVILDPPVSTSDDFAILATTHADVQSPDTSRNVNIDSEWQKATARIRSWQQSPSHIDEDGNESPSRMAINIAVTWLTKFIGADEAFAPHRIVSDGEGGIAFEYENGPSALTLEIADDGTWEYLFFENNRLVKRVPSGV